MFEPHPGIELHPKASEGTRAFLIWAIKQYLDYFGEKDPEESLNDYFETPESEWLRPEQQLVVARDLMVWVKGAPCTTDTAYFQQQMLSGLIRHGTGKVIMEMLHDHPNPPTGKAKQFLDLLNGMLDETPSGRPSYPLATWMDHVLKAVATYPDMGGKDNVMKHVGLEEFMRAALYLGVIDRATEIAALYHQVHDAQNWLAARFLDPAEVSRFFNED